MHTRQLKLLAPTLVVVSLIAGLILVSPSAVAEGNSAATESDPGQFARGAQTWADTCSRCHNMRDPNELRADQWRAAVAHMRVRSGLTGGETRDVLAFLQGSIGAQVTTSNFLVPPAAAEDNTDATELGQAIYAQTCIACHGADGKGSIPGVADFTDANGPLSKEDTELIRNISEGFQSPGSFIAMPVLGGNPALTEKDVEAVLDYIRTEFEK